MEHKFAPLTKKIILLSFLTGVLTPILSDVIEKIYKFEDFHADGSKKHKIS